MVHVRMSTMLMSATCPRHFDFLRLSLQTKLSFQKWRSGINQTSSVFWGAMQYQQRLWLLWAETTETQTPPYVWNCVVFVLWLPYFTWCGVHGHGILRVHQCCCILLLNELPSFFKAEWCVTVCIYPIVFVCSSLMDGWSVSVSWLLWYEVSKIVKFKEARASLVAQMVKNPPVMQETQVWALSWEDPLEKRMATHLCILAWRIPWTDEHGGLQSMGSQRVRHKWVTDSFMEARI